MRNLRILAISNLWQGATDYGIVRALRRAGHSVSVVSEGHTFPAGWNSVALRAIRKGISPLISKELQNRILEEAKNLRPHLLLVFKGYFVSDKTIDQIRRDGIIAINYYPDIDLFGHGPCIPKAMKNYDWIFTTKSFGLADMKSQLGVVDASFMPHPYDPETHFPVLLDEYDQARYACEASFIGNFSPKKLELLRNLKAKLPDLKLKVWGDRWPANSALGDSIMHAPVLGREYAKAITASKINIAILTGIRPGASSGDVSTTRTFEIPAVGGFMLHERTSEAESLFAEDRDCAMFSTADELAEKVKYYLSHEIERKKIAVAGYRRCMDSKYSSDDYGAAIAAKAEELLAVGEYKTAASLLSAQ